MFTGSLKVAIAGALFLGLSAAASTSASTESSHVNYLTFSRAVSLPGGVQLAPGKYRFEIPTTSQNGIVRVSSFDRETVYLTAFTHPIDRPKGDERRDKIVTLDDVASGGAASITAWFPIGEPMGQEFIYSK